MALIPLFDKKASIAFMGAENSTNLNNLDMELQGKLYDLLSNLYVGGYRYFYSGLYEGFDMIAAEIVLMLKMRGGHDEAKLICCITNQDQSADYSPEDRLQFRDLYTQADTRYAIGQQFTGSKLAIEDEFIGACSMIICWDDGEDDDLTFSLEKAKKAGVQIVNFAEMQDY